MFVFLAVGLTSSVTESQEVTVDTRRVFEERSDWRELPGPFLTMLANRLESPKAARDFIRIAEEASIYGRQIRNLIGQATVDTTFVRGMLSAMLTGYGNGLGSKRRFKDAKRTLELALLLGPKHVPAWSSMAITEVNTGNCRAAVKWAERVLAFEPDPSSDDPWEASLGRTMSAEDEEEAARLLGDPGMVGAWRRTQADMRMIVETCREEQNGA